MKAKIINSSNAPQRVNILPPMTPFFKVKYSKKGMIPTNSCEEIYVQFTPTDYKYYYDCIRIHGAGIILPIHAYPVINRSKDRLLPKLVTMKECSGSETSSKTTLYIECDCPVTFEYIIEWEEQHSDIQVSPMSGEIKALSKTPIEILYRPSMNTTAQATFKLTTTEFNSEPCIVRIVGSSVPGKANVSAGEINPYYVEEEREQEDDYRSDIKKTKTKTLLRNKPSTMIKRPSSGVKLKKIDESQLSTNRKGAETKEVDDNFSLKDKLTPDEKDFIEKYRQLEELDKTKEIKFFQCLGDPPITSEEINSHQVKRQNYINDTNMQRHDNIRYVTETDNDRVVIDTDLPMTLNPQLDLYQNNHFELRKRCLNLMLKYVNQMIIRQRAGKRLMQMKTKLKELGIKSRDDAKKMVIDDWKLAQNIFFDEENDVEFRFNINQTNIEFPKMPIEAGLTSIKEKVEAEMPTNFDDMVPFKPIEDLDFEIYNYKPFEIPKMSHYIPVIDEKPKRQGCEHEYTIRGPRGDPESYIKPHKEKIIEMPETLKKPFYYPRTNLLMPHPTLRAYVPLKRFTEVDPEFYLQPHPIPRVIPDDDLTIRADKNLDFASRFLRTNDPNLINSDIPGYVGINTIEKIPMEYFEPKQYRRHNLREGLMCDRTLERMPKKFVVGKDVDRNKFADPSIDYPSDEDSGNEEEFEIKIPSLEEFMNEIEKDDEIIHQLNAQEEKDRKEEDALDKNDGMISMDYCKYLTDRRIRDE